MENCIAPIRILGKATLVPKDESWFLVKIKGVSTRFFIELNSKQIVAEGFTNSKTAKHITLIQQSKWNKLFS